MKRNRFVPSRGPACTAPGVLQPPRPVRRVRPGRGRPRGGDPRRDGRHAPRGRLRPADDGPRGRPRPRQQGHALPPLDLQAEPRRRRADAAPTAPHARPTPDTGSLRGDLLALFCGAAWLDRPATRRGILGMVITALQTDPEFGARVPREVPRPQGRGAAARSTAGRRARRARARGRPLPARPGARRASSCTARSSSARPSPPTSSSGSSTRSSSRPPPAAPLVTQEHA